ncbi:MAG TPA: epoxide hydrolase, partial [Rectinemataceae bacterium]|nr:epoxide hydrolase [Rectinemataceae bacterium]
VQASSATRSYGYGLWLRPASDGRFTPYFQGSDPGVSFLSSHDPSTGRTITLVSNLGDDVWGLEAEIGRVLDAGPAAYSGPRAARSEAGGSGRPGFRAPRPFTIHLEDEVLADLRARIRSTRWPEPSPGPAWAQGTDLDYLKAILAYWAEGYDWRARERELNAFSHFRAEVDGTAVHFVHERAKGGGGIPLILGHGWPSSFVELLPLVPLLTDPAAHGIEGPSFDLVIPSLPGYGFSPRPRRAGLDYRQVAGIWASLMRGLGYERYGAGGGDFGAGVASHLAMKEPGSVIGLHLSNLEIPPYCGAGSRPLSTAEAAYLARNLEWRREEGGYREIQGTKPQTLAYALNDSPAGLASWILEKWRSWTDSGGDLDARFGRDFLLTTLTLYWATGTIGSSIRDYYDNRHFGGATGPRDFVGVPTGIALFSRSFVDEGTPPREWAERLYDIRRWTPMPRGGHFAPIEEPELLARDIAAFFGAL